MGKRGGAIGKITGILSICAALGATACAGQPRRTEQTGAAPHALRGKVFHQLRYHQAFPATRAEVADALAASTELDQNERAWVQAHLDRSNGSVRYDTGAEVLVALFPDAPATSLRQLAR